jgi:hypothetical protein
MHRILIFREGFRVGHRVPYKETNRTSQPMKNPFCIAICMFALAFTPVFGQQTPAPAAALTRFNLDFPGGRPAELVDAIDKASHMTLNAIIPTEDADTALPPLKMNDVDVVQLFAALEAASCKEIAVPVGNGNYTQQQISYGFRTSAGSALEFPGPQAQQGPGIGRMVRNTSNGGVSDDSIWYFYTDKPLAPASKICRFYSLASYLDRGFTVDDITTVIHTAWEIQAGADKGDNASIPDLSFHKETKLLIAVGDPNKLENIDQALNTLPAANVTSDEIDRMNKRITDLENEVSQLKRSKLPEAPGASSPAKSGQ